MSGRPQYVILRIDFDPAKSHCGNNPNCCFTPPEKYNLRIEGLKLDRPLPTGSIHAVIARRVVRAKHLLRADDELSLVEVAPRVGLSDQSKFSFHFKRIVGVTPRQFRISAAIQ